MKGFYDFAGEIFPLIPVFKGEPALAAQLIKHPLEKAQFLWCEFACMLGESHDAFLPSDEAKA
ncbi:hypothetical protein SAMN03159463_05876 [Mesorhizobium sp. NFR06]|uniref:hypothetical protein n=1 Tax=Mesorhizobium sp. NFR06 TaxID=1566290 RepID=UPI0008F22B38|nr:hypothetical protein [Mesorhizobium sp. NFR06]SFQ17762.1 hypothetical protein SAMN03159463_05876 [Mesorhizobium sp. NFR06]